MSWHTDDTSNKDFSRFEKPTSCYESPITPTEDQIVEVGRVLAAQKLAAAELASKKEAERIQSVEEYKLNCAAASSAREDAKAALVTKLSSLSPAERLALWPGEQEGDRFLVFTPWGEESVVIAPDGLTGLTKEGDVVTLLSVLL
ncbi:MAG: hypothetical protein WC525_09065 [Candidatus Thermoplasmatota archaeon]